MSDLMLAVQGNVVTPDGVIEDGFVVAESERIVSVGTEQPANSEGLIDARGKWVLPGIVDGQTHASSALDREGLGLASRAAAAGGVTTFVDMPYDAHQPVYNVAAFEGKVAETERDSIVDIALYATVRKIDGLDQVQPLIDAGACAFKMSSYEASPDRFARIALYDMLDVFRQVAPSGLSCGVHNENQEVIDYQIEQAREAGRSSYHVHNETRPPVSEALATAEVYEIGVATGCRAHVVHCSIDHGYELCQWYKSAGYAASIETCVQYLVFSEEDMETLGARIKQGPPIRPLPEREKLWQRVKDGQVDFVSSDHVAWPLESKSRDNFLDNSPGIPGLQTLLPAFYTGCVERNLGIEYVARLLSENVARHFCLYPQKGALAPGSDADITILDPQPWTFDEADCEGATEWSPYHGREFAGRVDATYVRGRQVWDGASVTGEAGYGRFVRPLENGE